MSNYSPVSLLCTSDGIELACLTAATTTAQTRGIVAVGVDASGTTRFIRVDSSGQPIAVGLGVAGNPAGGVLSVQGVVGGQPMPVSGTVTANQGVQGAHTQRWMIGLSDGTAFITPATDRTTAAAPFAVRLTDGTAFYDGTKTGQLPSALAGGKLDINIGTWLGSSVPTVGQKTMVQSVPVVLASDERVPMYTGPPNHTRYATANAITATAAVTRVAVRDSTYTEMTGNGQRAIASSSANDASAGTGARQVKVTYFDQTGAGPFTEILTLNGTTRVTSATAASCYIESMEVISVGSGGTSAGIITLYSSSAGGVAIGQISAGNTITSWAHHYVPTGTNCYIRDVHVHNTSQAIANGAVFQLWKKDLTSGNTGPEGPLSEPLRFNGAGDVTLRHYEVPLKVVGPARITMYVTPESTVAATQRAAFDWFEE